ncbi:MAG: DUF445 domain-containing protein, partial [Spirochaetaceae bacterium]|nr:DUF445 domain-containing protein [Spirochaetaceae bacterium]
MKQFVIDISIALIGGAAVGWLTNALAVSMLFKKFLGRWGGVIEEQYEAFIENMSALVEADLVNSHTLAATLNSPGFTQTLQNVVETLLMETLPGRSGELRLEELPDIERSLSRLLAQMQEVAPPGEKVYQLLAQQPLTGILSETQYQYMTHKVLKTLEGEGFFAEELRQGLYGFLSRLTPVDMAGEETLKRLGDNLGKQIRQTDFSRFDAPLDHAFEAVLTALDPDRLMEALQTALGAMTLGDFVSPAQVRKTLAPDLIRRCIAVSASKEGSALLLALMSALLAEAKTITLTLEDLLSPTVKAGIRAFIRERLPPLIEEIVALIRECEGEIEAIVNRSIEEELAANPLGGMFMVFKDLFMQNSARKWHIIDKLVVAVYQYGNEAGEKLTQVVLDYLRTTSIGSILTTLEAQKVLTPERMAAGFIRLLETQDGKPQPVLE